MSKCRIRILALLLFEALLICVIQGRVTAGAREIDEMRRNRISGRDLILADMKCFPVPVSFRDGIRYEDSFGAYRENGSHEGCDLMYADNVAGVVPVVSATDGVITNLGWLYLGGYRIGITAPSGIYYYYAHLDSYADGLFAGKEVVAGQLLGFMGNTGEGDEGTEGKFPVHLHFGIYRYDIGKGAENPYDYLVNVD